MPEKVVVAGAGFLGLNTALKLDRKGFEVELVDRNPYHQFVPGLIDLFRDRVSEEKLKLDLEDFLESTGIRFRQQEITEIRPEENRLETRDGKHSYDYLVLALGADPANHKVDISEVEHCYNLRGAREMAQSLEDSDSALIVGSGYVGIETAGELAEKEIDVTVVDLSTRPMHQSSSKASRIALEYMNEKDIDFKGDRKAIEVSEGGVMLADGEKLEAETVIWSGGIQASKKVQEWFDTGREGIPVNSGLASKEYENIFAGGDCADHDFLKTAHNAIEQSEVIAENIDKELYEDLEKFDHGETVVVSLGDTGMIIRGDRAYKNRFFRYLKDLIRKRYWFQLKKKKLKTKIY